jgi:hypothetical protein
MWEPVSCKVENVFMGGENRGAGDLKKKKERIKTIQ